VAAAGPILAFKILKYFLGNYQHNFVMDILSGRECFLHALFLSLFSFSQIFRELGTSDSQTTSYD
jgi:hypothetical protein